MFRIVGAAVHEPIIAGGGVAMTRASFTSPGFNVLSAEERSAIATRPRP